MTSQALAGEWQGKVVLITGASSGIGRATALALAARGASLVLGARRTAEGEAVAAEARAAGGAAHFVQTDVTREADVQRLVQTALDRFGRLDGAFNNAGTEGTFGPITGQTTVNYEHTFDANVRGVFYALKHEIPALLASGGGAIVNNTSVVGSVGFPNGALYAASKFAVEGLTKSVAIEVAKQGIRVNSVAPGGVLTDMATRAFGEQAAEGMAAMHPIGRGGRSEEIAAGVLFLLSPANSFMTGATLLLDGGWSAV